MRKRIIWIVGGVVILVIGFIAYRSISRGQASAATQAGLQTAALERGTLVAQIGASGTVRANQSAQLAWQTSGTVEEVDVALGDRVTRGSELGSLSQSSLPQNVILAQAELVEAQRALDILLNSTLQQAQALQAVEEAQKSLEDAQNPELAQAEALKAIASAEKAVEQAEINLANARSSASQSLIDEAEANVVLAKDRLDRAEEAYLPYAGKPESNLTRATLLSAYAAAKQVYDAAVRQLNSLQGTASNTDIAIRESELATAQAQLAESQREYERVKDGPSEAEIATLEAGLADAMREWERLEDGPDPEDIAAAESRVAAAEATLNQVRITAPFDGEITRVDNKPGDQVNPGSPAFRLDDLSLLRLDVEVSEVDINQVQVGQAVNMTFDAILGKEYSGQVVEVSPVGDELQGVVNFTVTVELTDADGQVKPGMTAAVTITVSELDDVLLVPNRAVRTLGGERVVYVSQGNASVPVPVTLGRSSDTHSQLLEGDLQVGDLIVLNPQTDFAEQFGPGGEGNPGGGGPFGEGGSP